MTLKTIFKNPVFRGMIIGFICSLVAFEWVRIQVGGIKHGESTFRFLREEATIEMHAEDIWKNGKSTLKEFNPTVCKVTLQEDWLNRWYEVSCSVENEQNFPCTYVARYGAGSSYFFWWLNLFSTTPSRESCYAK